MSKLIPSATYVFARFAEEGKEPLSERTIIDIFKREAAKKGQRLSEGTIWGGPGMAEFTVGDDIPFSDFTNTLTAIKSRTGNEVYVALSKDFIGNRYFDLSAEDALKAVRKDAILGPRI